MKARPILFAGEMVRAILAGRKTQTRRVVRDQGGCLDLDDPNDHAQLLSCYDWGRPGDRLWVRETWAIDCLGGAADGDTIESAYEVRFRADEATLEHCYEGPRGSVDPYVKLYDQRVRWRPSIHMPRWASRITLEVTGARVERLQDISEVDAAAEGIERSRNGDRPWLGALHPIKGTPKVFYGCRQAFASLWDSINGKRAPWASNPWVWAISFRRVEP